MTTGPVPVPVRVAVEELLARYAELVDDGDFAGIGALLGDASITVEDGTVVAHGPAAIEAFYERFTRRHPDGTPLTTHQITNLVIERGDEAGTYIARSVFVVHQATPELALQPIITGRYRDVVAERPDGTVVFVERRMLPRLHGDLREHLAGYAPPHAGD